MASPTVAATNTGTGDALGATSHTVNLPASISSGDLLVLVCGFSSDPSTVSASGFTFLSTDANGTNAFLAIGYKSASGSEGASISVSTVNSVRGAFTSYRITGWSGTPEKGTASTGSGTANPDPPSVTPSWGSADNLFIAIATGKLNGTATAAPTNYSNLLTNTTGGGASPEATGSAERQLTASTDDPGTFTFSANLTWVAQTLAIKPAGAASAAKLLAMLGVG